MSSLLRSDSSTANCAVPSIAQPRQDSLVDCVSVYSVRIDFMNEVFGCRVKRSAVFMVTLLGILFSRFSRLLCVSMQQRATKSNLATYYYQIVYAGLCLSVRNCANRKNTTHNLRRPHSSIANPQHNLQFEIIGKGMVGYLKPSVYHFCITVPFRSLLPCHVTLLFSMVSSLGIEPRTHALKGRCSTN